MVDFGHIVKYICVFTREAPDRLIPLPSSYPYPLRGPSAGYYGDLRRGAGRRNRRHPDDQAGLRAAAAQGEVWPADHVHRSRHGHSDDHRESLGSPQRHKA